MNDTTEAPEVAFSVQVADDTERPVWETRGRRYKRRTPYKRPRPDGTRRDLGEGDPDELGAVFASRADYFKENPQRETLQEIAEDSRDLGLVVQDFPGLRAFVFEMETARMKAVDRLRIIEEARADLEELARKMEAGELETGELETRLRETTSDLEKAERQTAHLRRELDAEAPREAVREDRLTLEEIEAEIPLTRSTLSEHIQKLREWDEGMPELQRRIATPKGGRLTRREVNELKLYLKIILTRPNRRKKRA